MNLIGIQNCIHAIKHILQLQQPRFECIYEVANSQTCVFEMALVILVNNEKKKHLPFIF